jgi:prepilin-type N-terminal cleavage/methylation domain-containing protein
MDLVHPNPDSAPPQPRGGRRFPPSSRADRRFVNRGLLPRRFLAAAGFTLVEVLVALAIMVMIAATVMPSVVGSIDRQRQDRALDALDALATAIGDFRTDVGVYPRSVVYLSQAIVSTDANSCGAVFGSTRAALWKGPYLSRIVPAAGLPIFVGTLQSLLVRTPTTGGTNPTLTMRVDNVLLADAEALDVKIDGAVGSTAGNIRWGTVTNGTVTLDYARAISGC